MEKSPTNDDLQLQRAEEKFRVLFEHSPVGMALIDHQTGMFKEANKSLLLSTGYSKEELVSTDFWRITPAKYYDQETEQIRDLNAIGRFGPNYKEYIRKDGSLMPMRISGFMLIDTDGKKLVWSIIEDLSEQQKSEDKIRRLAFYDTLTGLANRHLLMDRIAAVLALCRKQACYAALLFIDLNAFKSLNDQYGHAVGDALLIEVGRRLTGQLRKTDTAGRFGGDEFLVILGDLPADRALAEAAAKRVAATIEGVLARPYALACRGQEASITYHCSASIGVEIFNGSALSAEDVIEKADQSMYEAKWRLAHPGPASTT